VPTCTTATTVSILAILFAASAPAAAADDLPYTQHQNIVYAEVHGVGLVMDIFVPTGEKNGLGIVDVVSGAWYSDRSKIRDQALAQTFHIICRKGYTVFAVRPGSITKFGAAEMLAHVNQGIRWVKDHSKEYAIDPDRLGMMGASAGGHLACLAAVTAEAEKPRTWFASKTHGTRVKAVAVFFPPTDLIKYGDKVIDVRVDDRLGRLVRRLAFPQGLNGESTEELNQRITQISPARLVTAKAPPFLIVHGDADPLVPLQQSEVMLAALKKANVPAELIVKKGGTHPWITIHEEVALVADWFDKQLAK
jgi:acetyl esterase/lipase